MLRSGSRFRRTLGWLLAGAVLAWLAVPVFRNLTTVRSVVARPDGLLLALGALGFGAYFLLRGVLWITLARSASVRVPWQVAVRIWFLTEFARYLPGNVWSFVGRAGAMRAEGVPVRETGVLLVREAATIVATAALLVVGSGYAELGTGAPVLGITALGLGLLVLLLLPLRRFPPVPSARDRVRSVLLTAAAWCAFALGSAAVLEGLHAPGTLATLAAVSVTAWLLGYLALVTPSGLGVREAVLTALLIGGGLDAATAAALALASRIVLTAVEVLLVLAALRFLPPTRIEGRVAGSVRAV